MVLNENQKRYIVGLGIERARNNGLDINANSDKINSDALKAFEFLQSDQYTNIYKADQLKRIGGSWEDLVNLGDDDSIEKREQQKRADDNKNKKIQTIYDSLSDIEPVAPDTFTVIDNDDVGKVEQDLLEEYGNNFFELITYDKSLEGTGYNGKIVLAGVLKDVPSFSMSTEWVKGPMAEVADMVKDYTNNPMMEMFNGVVGKDRSWINVDEGTDRTYSKVSQKPSFNLNFKIYTTENIGSKSLTTWKTWLKALSLYAMPSISNKIAVNAMANHEFEALKSGWGMVKDVYHSTKNSLSNNTDDKDIVDKVGEAIKTFANTTESNILKRDNPDRAKSTANSDTFYGAKLWYLRILPGIFDNPLIVYISSWGLTYSRELNLTTGEPIWIEFKINCEMDQIPSVPIWMKYLSKDATKNGNIFKTYMSEQGLTDLDTSDYEVNF